MQTNNFVICLTLIILSPLALAWEYRFKDNIQDVFRTSGRDSKEKLLPPKLNKFVHKNCGHPETDVFNLTSLSISPDPVKLPGVVTLGASFNFRETARSPIKLQVEFYQQVRGQWLKIPCIAEVGSCTYRDLCAILELVPICPPQLVKANIPCKCPFAKGNYDLPPSEFVIPLPLLPRGDYRIKSVYTNGEKPGACLELFISFE